MQNILSALAGILRSLYMDGKIRRDIYAHGDSNPS